eukprot:CAMPEP_0119002950 /NCGR_PEP_ID=MMETSP1176-20130426/256_1 /TAXON_ID=265551 /ORGANISM="Synedropsis recta cf, Strain CCMP1620" /LENGTH=367 /DNA_ID=CAMNT_0006954495 /DNA_START=49 /DNA_END=1155 /DNA_ORIENTATION=+
MSNSRVRNFKDTESIMLRYFVLLTLLHSVAASLVLRGIVGTEAAERPGVLLQLEQDLGAEQNTLFSVETAMDRGDELDPDLESVRKLIGEPEGGEDYLLHGDEESEQADEFVVGSAARKLLQSVPCPNGGPVAFFNLEIDFIPDADADVSACTDLRKKELGDAINGLLTKYGIGTTGEGATVAYLAHVCSQADTTISRRKLSFGYVYNGSGSCRSCGADDSDRRQLSIFDPNWFQDTYKPELEEILSDAIMSDITPIHQQCLANVPEALVVVTAVSQSELGVECPTKHAGCCTWGDWSTCPDWTYDSKDWQQQSPSECESDWGSWIYEGCCTWGDWSTCPSWTLDSKDYQQHSPTNCESDYGTWIWN